MRTEGRLLVWHTGINWKTFREQIKWQRRSQQIGFKEGKHDSMQAEHKDKYLANKRRKASAGTRKEAKTDKDIFNRHFLKVQAKKKW